MAVKTNAALAVRPARHECGEDGRLSSGRDFQLGADMVGDLGRVVIDEVTYAMMGNVSQRGPGSERANGRFFAGRENPALAQTDNIRELTSEKSR